MSPLARQTRPTIEGLTPRCLARLLVLQCVAWAGFCWVVTGLIVAATC